MKVSIQMLTFFDLPKSSACRNRSLYRLCRRSPHAPNWIHRRCLLRTRSCTAPVPDGLLRLETAQKRIGLALLDSILIHTTHSNYSYTARPRLINKKKNAFHKRTHTQTNHRTKQNAFLPSSTAAPAFPESSDGPGTPFTEL